MDTPSILDEYQNHDVYKSYRLEPIEMLELKVLMLERQVIEQKIKGYLGIALAKRGLTDQSYEVSCETGEIRRT
jgi:hypothetical protein